MAMAGLLLSGLRPSGRSVRRRASGRGGITRLFAAAAPTPAQNFRYYAPPEIIVGGGAATSELPALVTRLGLQRPLVVTGPTVFKNVVGPLLAALEEAGITAGVFHESRAEPTVDEVRKGLEAYHAGRHDGLIAVGGGSPMDVAKVVAVLVTNSGEVRDFKVPNEIPLPGAPLVAVPTTAGTGAEVSRSAVISDPAVREKMLVMSPRLVPTAAVVDYRLSLTCPKRITADAGMDAFIHAMEGYISRKANPLSDPPALAAMSTIHRNIRRVWADGDDEAAREAMMLAASQAGMAFSNSSVALVHAMSRPVGVHFNVPHGLSNAMLLPLVTKFSTPAAPGRYADCARNLGLTDAAASDTSACEALVTELVQLSADLQVPSLRDFGIEEGAFMELRPLMAEQALASGSPANNPYIPSAEEIVDLYGTIYSTNGGR